MNQNTVPMSGMRKTWIHKFRPGQSKPISCHGRYLLEVWAFLFHRIIKWAFQHWIVICNFVCILFQWRKAAADVRNSRIIKLWNYRVFSLLTITPPRQPASSWHNVSISKKMLSTSGLRIDVQNRGGKAMRRNTKANCEVPRIPPLCHLCVHKMTLMNLIRNCYYLCTLCQFDYIFFVHSYFAYMLWTFVGMDAFHSVVGIQCRIIPHLSVRWTVETTICSQAFCKMTYLRVERVLGMKLRVGLERTAIMQPLARWIFSATKCSKYGLAVYSSTELLEC